MQDVAVEKQLLIVNKKGLHARATAKFVKTVSAFDASVKVGKRDADSGEVSGMVSGTSILGLMMLGADPGSTIVVEAEGAQAQEVADALEALVADKFGEGD